jgi:DNA-binding IclR family transcriptional regulator
LYIYKAVPAAPASRNPKPRIRPVPAVARAAAILRLLSRSEEPVGVNAVARALGLVPSTALHILRALAQEEFVVMDQGTKGWRLDTGLVNLARRALQRGGFTERAQPMLDRLSSRHRVTAIAVQVGGLDHMTVLAISRSDVAVRLHVDIGSRFPALISATGRCLAAFGEYGWSDLTRGFGRLRWDVPPTLATWRREIAEARRKGYAIDRGNYIRGITVLAVPVLDRNATMTHAVVAVGVAEQLRAAGLQPLITDLTSAAAELGFSDLV